MPCAWDVLIPALEVQACGIHESPHCAQLYVYLTYACPGSYHWDARVLLHAVTMLEVTRLLMAVTAVIEMVVEVILMDATERQWQPGDEVTSCCTDWGPRLCGMCQSATPDIVIPAGCCAHCGGRQWQDATGTTSGVQRASCRQQQ
jgi:hypothetical protein